MDFFRLQSRKQRIATSAGILARTMAQPFSIDLAQRVDIEGSNTPTLRNGNRVLNLDFSIPDDFTDRTGLLATIFVRMDDDFTRITTSVRKQNGQRAIGTHLDRSQPAYRCALEGKPYVGYATIFGKQCITRYDPLRDRSGHVVGILFVGLDVSSNPAMSMAAAMAWKLSIFNATLCTLFSVLTGRLTDPAQWAFAGLSTVSIGIITYILMKHQVMQPVMQGRHAALRLAAGDLTNQVHVHEGDDIGQMLLAINGISVGLTGLVGNVRQAASMVTDGTREIADGNMDLANRTEQQAGEVNAAASAMHELTIKVSQNADRANQLNGLVASVSELAMTGGAVVGQVVDTMGQIKSSAQRINDIIGMIDGIAFQTNILALNAAVEAARAGEQGRGFAVVATEVRSLAQRSASAAREIKVLIDTSVHTANAGSNLVEKASLAMTQITQSVQEVVGFIDSIALSSNEQRAGIESVNHSVGQIDQMTQQNAALVEQSAAAAMKMRDQATQLESAVDIFKTP